VISGKSWSAFVGPVNPVDQGCDRHGQIGVGGNLRQRAGEGRSAEFAAVHLEAAQIVHSLRGAKAEPDRWSLCHFDNRSDQAELPAAG
jgi:hypothetical protein